MLIGLLLLLLVHGHEHGYGHGCPGTWVPTTVDVGQGVVVDELRFVPNDVNDWRCK